MRVELHAERIAALLAATVAVAAVLGRAFDPATAMVLGSLVAVLIGCSILVSDQSLQVEEICLLLLVSLGAAVAGARWSGLLEAKEVLAGWLAAALLWICCRHAGDRAGRWGLALLGAAALCTSLDIVLETVGRALPGAGGFYENPNVAAALLVPMAAAVWVLRRRGNRLLLLVISSLTALCVAGALLTGSRAAVLALVAAAAVGLPKGRLRLVCVAAAVAVGLAFVAWRFTVHPDSLAWHRIAIWRALAQLVAEHPLFGVGPGALGELSGSVRIAHEGGIAQHLHRIGSAESTPLGLLLRSGAVGVTIAAVALWSWVASARREGFFADGARRAVLASIVVFCLVHDELDMTIVLWWWAAFLGSVEAVAGGGPKRGEWRPPGAARWLTALAVCGCLSWGIVQPASARHLWFSEPPTPALAERAWRAERWFVEPLLWRSLEVLERPQWRWEDAAEAIYWSRRAVEIDRGRASLWANVGQVHARVVNELVRWPDAVASAREGYRRATALEPHLPWSWLHWARLERSLGETESAARLTRRAVEQEPNFVRGWLFLARLEIDRGRPQAAREAYEAARRAWALRRSGTLTQYDADLLNAPAWQFRDVARHLE